MSVNLLMTSPAAKGLFAKAITESGLGRIPAKPLAAAEAQGSAFAKSVGAKDIAALRALPAEAILAGPMSSVESGDNPGPIVDGELVPTNVDRAFAEGREAPVPWIVGSNNYEASLFPAMLADPDGDGASPGSGRGAAHVHGPVRSGQDQRQAHGGRQCG